MPHNQKQEQSTMYDGVNGRDPGLVSIYTQLKSEWNQWTPNSNHGHHGHLKTLTSVDESDSQLSPVHRSGDASNIQDTHSISEDIIPAPPAQYGQLKEVPDIYTNQSDRSQSLNKNPSLSVTLTCKDGDSNIPSTQIYPPDGGENFRASSTQGDLCEENLYLPTESSRTHTHVLNQITTSVSTSPEFSNCSLNCKSVDSTAQTQDCTIKVEYCETDRQEQAEVSEEVRFPCKPTEGNHANPTARSHSRSNVELTDLYDDHGDLSNEDDTTTDGESTVMNINASTESRESTAKPHKCDLCDKRYRTKGLLATHYRVHTGEKPYSCTLCTSQFTTKGSLKTHHLKVHTLKLYTCEVCGKGFNLAGSYHEHMCAHRGEKPYKCEVCGKQFNKPINLKTHSRTHTGERPHECDVCGKRFSHSTTLQTHQLIHTGERPFKCDYCEMDFRGLASLRSHRRIHTGEKPYACKICGKRFIQIGQVQNHLRTHTGEKPFKCDVCGRACASSSDLHKHMRVHTGEKPFKCDICGRGFSEPSSVTKHKRIHTGEKPFKCPICGKGFAESSSVPKHIRVHTGEKPFVCDICGKRFKEGGGLRAHRMIHTGERPYRCGICGKGFIQTSNLHTHLIRHTEGTDNMDGARLGLIKMENDYSMDNGSLNFDISLGMDETNGIINDTINDDQDGK